MILGLIASLSLLGSGSKTAGQITGFDHIKPISVIHGDVGGQMLAAAAVKDRENRARAAKEWAKKHKGGKDDDDKDSKKERNERGGPELDSPLDELLWLRQTLTDSSGTIPAYGLKLAYAQRAASIAYQNLSGSASRGINPALTLPSGATWTNRGPSDIGGRTRSLVVLPNGTTLIAGSVGGGVWRSLDSGASWTQSQDHMGNIAVDTIALDPSDSTHLFAGTGEAFFNSDADSGGGIFESHDTGATWSLISSTASFGNVAKIAIDPSNHLIVLASTVNGVGGIQRSTDGGQTWTTVKSLFGSMDVVFDPFANNRVLAHTMDSSTNHVSWYSTDTGATWTQATGMGPFSGLTNGRMSYTFSKLTQNLVYCACGANNGEVFKSTDGGVTWSAASGTNVFLQSWYNDFIFIDPANDQNLFISDNPSSDVLQKSSDGGATWTTVSNGYGNFQDPHADEHFAVSDPTNTQRVYFTTDGGIYKTNNISTAASNSGWTNLNNGYITTQYYSVDATTGGIFVGGLQDNFTLMTVDSSLISNASLNNYKSDVIFGGDGGFTAIDHTNPAYVYGEYVYLNIFSTFGQLNPTTANPSTDWVNEGLPATNYITSGLTDSNNSSRANFISPFILDPNNQQTLLAGGTNLWRTTNARGNPPTWTNIRADGSTAQGSNNKISTITVADGNSDLIWVGQNNGQLSKTTNGTAATPTWTDITGPQSGRYVQHVTIDPSNSNRVFVAYGGLASNPLWVSTNGGTTWSTASGSGVTGLPSAPVRYMSIHPNNANWLFAGTMVGLYSSVDGGATWSTNNFGPANVDTWDCKFIPGTSKLLLGTHGRGVWTQNQIAMNTVTTSAGTVSAGGSLTGTVNTFGQGDTGGTSVALTASSGVTVPATVTVPAGASTANFTITTSSGASGSASVTATVFGTTATATFSITASNPTVQSVSLSPTSVAGGVSSTGTVTLTASVGSDTAVSLSSDNTSAATVPSTVTVLSGHNTATFTVTSIPVATDQTANIGASYNSSSASAPLTVTAPVLSSIGVSPNSLPGGQSATATVTLDSAAPTGGTLVTLASDTGSAATIQANVTVSANQTTATATVSTSSVATNTVVTLTATLGATNKTTSLTVTTQGIISLTVSPTAVTGGTPSTGTVTLSAATGADLDVALSSSNTAAATVNPTVTVTNSNSTATFTVTTVAVSATASVTITGSVNGTQQTATLTVNAATVASVSLSPTTVTGGTSSTGTVTLTSAAGTGGDSVSLSSSNAAATVPPTMSVAGAATTGTFTVTTSGVASNTTSTITATFNGSSQTAVLTLNAPTVSALSVSPTTVVGGVSSTGTITLGSAGPAGGVSVSLSSNNAAATVPSTTTVTGASGTFTVTTVAVATDRTATLTATFNSTSQTATLTIKAPTVSNLTMSPTTVAGGVSSTGTVTLSSAAPTGGILVGLASNNAAATVSSTVPVPVGSLSATFAATTVAVASNQTATITATLNSSSHTATLTVTAPTVSNLTLNPTSVSGGGTSTGTVTLSSVSPTGGILVALSSNSASATVNSTVPVPVGSNAANFTVTTTTVATTTSATITATFNSTSKTATLSIQPVTLASLTLSPTTVASSGTSTGTVTLGAAAPTGGVSVSLSSSDTGVATVPASVTVNQTATSATFTATAKPVSGTCVITATANGSTKTATLTVGSITITSITLNASSIIGGNADTGGVFLSTAAPTGGSIVQLSNNASAVFAEFPSTVTVPAGATLGTYRVSTVAASQTTVVTITATLGTSSKTVQLTVGPPQITLLSLAPNPLVGGNKGLATITLNGSVGADNDGTTLTIANVSFTSSPSGIVVFAAKNPLPGGATSGVYTFNTVGVSASTNVSVTASVFGSSKTSSITIIPATITKLTPSVTAIPGGSSVAVTASLNGFAGPGGNVITLDSSNTAALTTPVSATVPQGTSLVTFNVGTAGVDADTNVTVTGHTAAVSATTTITVQAPHALQVLLSVPSVQGGTGLFGGAYLDAQAGPSGAVITLSSNNTAVATVPASVTVGAGLTSNTFAIVTHAVTSTKSVTITEVYGGVTKTVVLTVTP